MQATTNYPPPTRSPPPPKPHSVTYVTSGGLTPLITHPVPNSVPASQLPHTEPKHLVENNMSSQPQLHIQHRTSLPITHITHDRQSMPVTSHPIGTQEAQLERSVDPRQNVRSLSPLEYRSVGQLEDRHYKLEHRSYSPVEVRAQSPVNSQRVNFTYTEHNPPNNLPHHHPKT